MISFSQLEHITGAARIAFFADSTLSSLIIDSRKAIAQEGAIFFAIRGERHDGHQYIHDLYQLGIRQFVVEEAPENSGALHQCNIAKVTSSIDALQKLAAYHRSQFSIPVIGITGSNGKTIIKEWLYQLLSKDHTIVKNPGSYNSQVGVPLSVWQMQQHHQLGIFEAGISKPGEMEKLASVIQPTLGIFSTIGSAHDEGFANRSEKIAEKLKLFENSDALIYCKDHTEIDQAVRQTSLQTFTWGADKGSDVHIQRDADHYTIVHSNNIFTLQLPFSDPASVENAFHCVAIMLWMKYSAEEIQLQIRGLRAVPMRLELKEGINRCQVIDDTYNNDLGGLDISLQFLSHQHQKNKKALILSDVLESGLEDERLAKEIFTLVKESGIHRFIGIGPVMIRYRDLFPSAVFYSSTDDFLTQYDLDQFQQEVILVKGARSFQFEKIVSKLQQKVHGTVMEVDLGALVHNLNYFKSMLKPSTKVMVMVKAFAYGSGSTEIANLLQYHRADYLGVAYADEGVELRKNNSSLPIMVMNPTEESFDQLLTYDLEPEIYNFKLFHSLLKYLNGQGCTVHIKLDTGMHRLGFEEGDLQEVISLLKSNPNIRVASIFSHLAGADEHEHDQFSNTQASKFKTWADQLSAALEYKPLYHILNSPGILRLRDFQFDMVRLGIGLYGVDPTSDGYHPLKPAATLKTIISQVKTVKAGESIGYGRRGTSEKNMKLATIAIGYADGFTRAFSRGAGVVLIRGKRAPVVGNVCMDMTMVDVTGIDAQEGDEVIIFGKELPIQEVAERIHTIPYEILTNTSERVKRIFVAEGI
jgi:alanine racemase